MADNQNLPDRVPNVGIENPQTRHAINTALNVILLVVAIVVLFFGFFPELAPGDDIVGRASNFIVAAIGILTSAFGLGVTNRNYPKF